jgi:hypothetical protein
MGWHALVFHKINMTSIVGGTGVFSVWADSSCTVPMPVSCASLQWQQKLKITKVTSTPQYRRVFRKFTGKSNMRTVVSACTLIAFALSGCVTTETAYNSNEQKNIVCENSPIKVNLPGLYASKDGDCLPSIRMRGSLLTGQSGM